jgi:voltage-gated potassium channel
MSESAAAEPPSPQSVPSPALAPAPARSIRRRLHEILEVHDASDRTAHYVSAVIVTFIVVNVAAFIASTVDAVAADLPDLLYWIEAITVAGFGIEYATRLWVCVEDPRYMRPLAGRLRWARTPLALVDLIAIVPFFLVSAGSGFALIRIFRIVRLAKLWRYSRSLQLLGRVAMSKREELLVTTGLMMFALLIASTLLYYVERSAQPEAFSSVPAAMWWGIATLSTVGYGDVYPVTPLGRLLAGAFAVFGIAMFALPIAILSAAFAEEFELMKYGERRCPHCGHRID